MTAYINKLKDKTGNQQLPVTHERAVRDDNGTTLESKMQNLEGAMDKAYVAQSDNGMGRITLKKNMVSGVNTLTQNMMQATNTIYVIRYDFTVRGTSENISLNFTSSNVSGVMTPEKAELDAATAAYDANPTPENLERKQRAQAAYEAIGSQDYYYWASYTIPAQHCLHLTGRAFRLNDSKNAYVATEYNQGIIYAPNNESLTVYVGNLAGQYSYLKDGYVRVPANCVLEFDGGSISGNGTCTITGTNTGIQAGLVKIFNTNVTLAGSWNVTGAYPEWFWTVGGGSHSDAIQKCIDTFKICILSSDSYNIDKSIIMTGIIKGRISYDNLQRTRLILVENIPCFVNPSSYNSADISNLCIVPSGSLVTKDNTYGFYISGNYHMGPLYIKHVTIEYCQYGFKDEGSSGGGTYNITIDDMFLYNCVYGFYKNLGTTININKLIITNCQKQAIHLRNCKDVVINNSGTDLCSNENVDYSLGKAICYFLNVQRLIINSFGSENCTVFGADYYWRNVGWIVMHNCNISVNGLGIAGMTINSSQGNTGLARIISLNNCIGTMTGCALPDAANEGITLNGTNGNVNIIWDGYSDDSDSLSAPSQMLYSGLRFGVIHDNMTGGGKNIRLLYSLTGKALCQGIVDNTGITVTDVLYNCTDIRDFIKKISGTSGNVPMIKSDGTLEDSGKAATNIP